MAIRINIKGTASYPHLSKPHRAGRPGSQSSDPKYSIVTILDDDNDWKAINGALEAEKASGFPQGWPANGNWPLKQFGEQDAPRPEFVGKWYMNASSAEKPPVVNHNVLPIPDSELDSQVYPGCKVIVAVAIASYNNVQRGVGCFLNAVQKIGEGPRLDDRPTVNQMFTTQTPQNAAGYSPAAFPTGTPQNPGGPAAGPQGAGPYGPNGSGGQVAGPAGGPAGPAAGDQTQGGPFPWES